MLVICEECGKKYRIDETKIKGEMARVRCRICNHIIEITKSQPVVEQDLSIMNDSSSPVASDESFAFDMSSKVALQSSTGKPRAAIKKTPQSKIKGLSIAMKLIFIFIGFILVTGGGLTFVYLKTVPLVIEEQIELRAMDIAKTAATGLLLSIRERNYLQINHRAQFFSKLSGVGYFYVMNKKGMVLAGKFGKLDLFSRDFVVKVKEEGFPEDMALKNKMPRGLKRMRKELNVGGQQLIEYAIKMQGDLGEVHVGMLTKDIDDAIQSTLRPLFFVLGMMAILGSVAFFLLARNISRPVKQLTDAARRISLGEIDLPVNVKGGGEIAELADSIERMRFSVSSAIERLRKR
jgi:predicted Zn finger-like uncharacterized protein